MKGKKLVNEANQTFAKQQLGMKLNETKMLGLAWKKNRDLLAVEIPSEIKKLTKRTVIQKLASIYNPPGIISPEQNSARLDCEKMGAMGEETTNKSKHSKNN